MSAPSEDPYMRGPQYARDIRSSFPSGVFFFNSSLEYSLNNWFKRVNNTQING
jgi:hypothetical protein